MIIVTGTRRSGTSMWMRILAAAGFPIIGERFPADWEELVGDANPDGFYESQLAGGIYHRTNPHPLTGEYLFPERTRDHAVKVFLPGLIRTDVAFIDRCIATVRDWREYVLSVQELDERVAASQPGQEDALDALADLRLPPALEWWADHHALVRDLATRRYPVHVCSYQSLLDDPRGAVAEVLEWLGGGDLDAASRVVARGKPRRAAASPADVDSEHAALFDEFYQRIHEGRALDAPFVERLNALDSALRPEILELHARARFEVARKMLDGRFGATMDGS